MTTSKDVVIIGGGVIGFSIADALAQEGASVTVLDAGLPGQASSAAAGMLAPLAESGKPGAFVDMALESLRRYPAFVAQVRDESGVDVRIAGPGMLHVARTDAEEAALGAALDWQRATGLPLEQLTGTELRRLEPALSPEVRAGILSPEEKHITPRRLLTALQKACIKRGVRHLPGTTAVGMETTGKRVIGVQTAPETVAAGLVVIAGGAWSPKIGAWLGVSFPIVPIKGQGLALGPCIPQPTRYTLYTHGTYLVPRDDGDLIVGATEENEGYETETTTCGIQSLRYSALALMPGLQEVPLQRAWAGLRPVSLDGLPLLGRVPEWENVYIATGHGRNGILLTPITGKLMADHLLHNIPPPSAFDPARFGERT